MLTQNLRERDLSICPQYLLIAHTAHFLVCCRVNIRVRRKDVIADVLLDSLFQKQFADAVTKHTEDSFQRFSEDFRQEVSGVFALQITAVEQNCFCNEFVLRAAPITFVVFLHPLPYSIFHPNCMTASFFCFHVQNLLKSE